MNEHDPVGSLSDELSKLLQAVSGLTESVAETTADDSTEDGSATTSQDSGPTAESAAGASEHRHHIADGSASCQLCPLCQSIAFIRSTSPEVREQLAASASALTVAARGILEAFAAQQRHARRPSSSPDDRSTSSGVQNIDLSEDETWD